LDEPGIYRLQHASLLFRSQSTRIIVAPVFCPFENYWLDALDVPVVDAILISHSHGDHFCPLTLMHYPNDVTIIVPRVEMPSMLCPDMASLLRDAGFTNVIDAPWYSKQTVGDIQIGIYPFYGEQPWLTFCSPLAGFRNAGNTYVVDVDGLKTWFLIDSGTEHGSSMKEVCARVRAEEGEIDVVMSNLREFPWHPAQIDGSGRYLFCFPMERLENPEQWPHGRLMTFGPLGMREFLTELGAKHFFPYAHWWHPLV
jgi:L-ascorbate metabolism protein UlaG (beta-lactamase superfamily)